MAEFWANPGTEPKRIYRWVMRFNINSENAIDEWIVKKVKRPAWSLTESKHNFLNHTFYYPGRVQYEEMTVTLVDSISTNAAVNMQNLLVSAGYVLPDAVANTRDYQTVSKEGWGSGAGNAGLGAVTITQLDHDGRSIETWQLFNTWVKSCNLNELNYESDDLLNIDLTLRYDYFKIDSGVHLSNARIDPMWQA